MPQDRGFSGGKKHSPHTGLGGVDTADYRWVIGHNLREACGTVCDAPGESFKVRQVCPQVRGDPDSMFVRMGEPQLEGPKEPGGSGNHGSHESELP